MRICVRAGSSNSAMKPTSTPRISATSPASRSNTAPLSAADTASAARLRASFMGGSVIRHAAARRRCYRTETIETILKE